MNMWSGFTLIELNSKSVTILYDKRSDIWSILYISEKLSQIPVRRSFGNEYVIWVHFDRVKFEICDYHSILYISGKCAQKWFLCCYQHLFENWDIAFAIQWFYNISIWLNYLVFSLLEFATRFLSLSIGVGVSCCPQGCQGYFFQGYQYSILLFPWAFIRSSLFFEERLCKETLPEQLNLSGRFYRQRLPMFVCCRIYWPWLWSG